VSIAAAAMLLVACGDQGERSMCDAFDDYRTTAEAFSDTDIANATVDEAIVALEELDAAVAQLRAVADTQNEAMVDQLDRAVRDLVNSLRSVGGDVALADVGDLVDDDAERVSDAAEAVRSAFTAICSTPD
jgi:hypothetical protein